MQSKLEATLRETFPDLLSNCSSIRVMDGWYTLLSQSLKEVNTLVKKDEPALYKITEIKVRHGGLFVAMSTFHEEIESVLLGAEEDSETVCEVCGEDGVLIADEWLRTRCPAHADIKGT